MDKVEEVVKSSSSVDFFYQLNLSRERVEKKLFSMLCQIASELFKSEKNAGVLIVLGAFDNSVSGMRFFGSHKLEKYLNITSKINEEEILNIFRSGEDGAVVINDSGQVLGIGIYLTVDDPTLDIPEGAGTRHISAASFSAREDVIATYTLSEENTVVRKWKDGVVSEQFNPAEIE